MTEPEVQWVFDQLEQLGTGSGLYGEGLYGDGFYHSEPIFSWGTVSDVEDGEVPVQRVDRNESEMYDRPGIRSREGELQRANFIGVAMGDRPTEPAGTSHHRTEAIVSVRIEGLHTSKYGHVDPTGEDGIPFKRLYDGVRWALRDGAGYPDVDREGAAYTTAFVENETNRSSDHRDFYDYRLDVRFRGYD